MNRSAFITASVAALASAAIAPARVVQTPIRVLVYPPGMEKIAREITAMEPVGYGTYTYALSYAVSPYSSEPIDQSDVVRRAIRGDA